MSDSSDSEETFSIEDVPEQSRQSVQSALQKGKSITPFYSDLILYKIYRRYYQSEKVFLNELQLIADKRKKDMEEKEGDWIFVGENSKIKSSSSQTPPPQKKKYSFMLDQKLIERAKNWEKGEKQLWKEKDEKNKTNDGPKFREKNKKYVEKRDSQSFIQYKEKSKQNEVKYVQKQKYKQKQEPKYKEKQQHIEYKQKDSKHIQYKEKQSKQYNSKHQKKYVQKEKESGKKLHEEKKQTLYVQKQTVKEEKKYVEKKEQTVINSHQNQHNVPQKQVQSQNPKKIQVEDKKEVQEKKIKYEEKKQTQIQPQNSQKQIQTQSKTLPMEEFQNSLKKYPKMLSFIKPGQKTQIVSYVLSSKGLDQVKIRVPLQ